MHPKELELSRQIVPEELSVLQTRNSQQAEPVLPINTVQSVQLKACSVLMGNNPILIRLDARSAQKALTVILIATLRPLCLAPVRLEMYARPVASHMSRSVPQAVISQEANV